jgi:hypothetical protein
MTNWTLRARHAGVFLVVTAIGEATVESLRTLRAFVRATIETRPDTQAVVIDFTGALSLMGAGEWSQTTADAKAAGINVPMALVVPRDCLEPVGDICLAQNRLGLRRMAFTDLDRAFSWCRVELAESLEGLEHAQSPTLWNHKLKLVHSRR